MTSIKTISVETNVWVFLGLLVIISQHWLKKCLHNTRQQAISSTNADQYLFIWGSCHSNIWPHHWWHQRFSLWKTSSAKSNEKVGIMTILSFCWHSPLARSPSTNGLVQYCGNSSANTLHLLQSNTNLTILVISCLSIIVVLSAATFAFLPTQTIYSADDPQPILSYVCYLWGCTAQMIPTTEW